jgi:D-alanyl-D-alanine carboxypeptidase (penicillin-binding protein 5/6)
MSRAFINNIKKLISIRLITVMLAIVMVLGVLGSVASAATADYFLLPEDDISEQPSGESTDESTAEVLQPVYPSMEVTVQGALVVGTGRGMILYQDQQDDLLNIPAASKLMCAVIALESISVDTQITISSEVEHLDAIAEYSLSLSKGEKCTASYLVAAMLYRDSDAAALSLAEYISTDEKTFVTRMNETAKSLGMNNTKFVNTSGAPVYNTVTTPAGSISVGDVDLQYSTLTDMSLLFRYALNVESFQDIFTKYRSLLFLSDGTPQFISSSMTSAWGLSSKILGAARFNGRNTADTSCVLAYAGVDNFAIAVLLIGVENESVYNDLKTVIDTIFSQYEVSNLVSAGDGYRKISIKGIADPVPSVFKNTITYVHPVGDDFIQKDADFIASEFVTLPIRQGELLGQVVFVLDDGTQIAAEVVSETDVWTKTTMLSDTINMLQSNQNLATIIALAIIFFIMSASYNIGRMLLRIHDSHRRHKHK